MLAATDLGNGTCWLEENAQPYEVEFTLLLNIPEHLRILSLVPIGIPVECPKSKKEAPGKCFALGDLLKLPNVYRLLTK